jgi:hypothetical protein
MLTAPEEERIEVWAQIAEVHGPSLPLKAIVHVHDESTKAEELDSKPESEEEEELTVTLPNGEKVSVEEAAADPYKKRDVLDSTVA